MTKEEMSYLTQKLGYEPDLKWVTGLKERGFTLDDIVEALEFL